MKLFEFNPEKLNHVFTITNQDLNKEAVLNILKISNISLNEFAHELINSTSFDLGNLGTTTSIIELKLEDIGLNCGGSFSDIESAISNSNISFCPIELGPYLRLKYNAQIESKIFTKNQHPDESIVIFSKPIIRNDLYPKGFYLRNYDGKLWLRGYRCSEDYIWNGKDRMLFQFIP